MKRMPVISSVAFLVIILDYITKKVIISNVMHFESIQVFPFLNIVFVENKGAAFGLFAHLGNHIFMIISVLAIIFILVYVTKFAKGIEIYALSLILGGAIGNLIDRIRSGKVIDFIDFHVGNWHWPAFNIADSALTVGIIIFIWSNIWAHGKKTV